jgi:predicted GH43/DUF377 family glycosyl hydrolase
MLPVADRIGGDVYRIYFASRNRDNMSQIGYVEVNMMDPTRILSVSESPIVELGELGTFDDSGVFPSAIVTTNGKKYLYYVGWMQGKRVPFYGMVGLAVSSDGGKTFEKYSRAPLLPRNEVDPYMTLSLCVMPSEGVWRMWYTSTTECIRTSTGDTIPNYHIKYAESEDGVNWKREGIVCIDYEHKAETRIARPRVIFDSGRYRMWYCYAKRADGYRIGYAESLDGRDWKRLDDQVGIDMSTSGWDSEMLAYPYIIDWNRNRYMFYNGNNYGETGFGIAFLSEDADD